jgi:hypothetical protein
LFELGGLGGGEQVGVEERLGEESGEGGGGVGDRDVFGDVPRGVAKNEGEMRAGLKGDGAGKDVAQGGIGRGGAGFAEGEFYEGVFGEGGVEKG